MPAASQAPGGRLPGERGLLESLPVLQPTGPGHGGGGGLLPWCPDSPAPGEGASPGFPASPTSEEHPGRPSPMRSSPRLPLLGGQPPHPVRGALRTRCEALPGTLVSGPC